MTSRRAGAAILTILALGACAPAMVSTDTGASEAVIRARSEAWLQSVQARDADRFMSFYAPGAVFSAPGIPATSDAAQIRAAWTQAFADPGFSLTWRPTSVTVAASGDVATEVGTYDMAFTTPTGRATDRGSYTAVWRNVNGQWVVISDMAASSVPPTAPAPPVGAAHAEFDTGPIEMLGAGGLNWQPLNVPGFPGGAQIAVMHGNPFAEGDYALRLRFPDGYRVPVHWHPKAEHVTVLSGTFDFAMSGDSTSATHPHPAGDFLYLPPRMPHHGRMRGETVLQLHGMGPFAINLGTP